MRLTLLFLIVFMLMACSSQNSQDQKQPEPAKGEKNVLEIGAVAQHHMGLKTDPAVVTELKEYLHVTGSIQPIDGRIAEVRPLAKGRIEDVAVKVGDRVAKGQLLATFQNVEAGELISQYHSIEAELEHAKVQLAAAIKQTDRKRRLAEIGAVPQKDVELSQSEQDALQADVRGREKALNGIASRLRFFGIAENFSDSPTISILAPFAGVVIRAAASPGESVGSESELFHLADLSHVWVQADVYEKDLGRLKIGQPALISVDTYPNERFEGTVSYAGDIVDPQTRTVKVRCEVVNPSGKLKLDMFALVDLPTTFRHSAIAVPAEALQQVEGNTVVFVRKAATKFEIRQVQAGKTVDGQTEINEGLQQGDAVVTSGAFHLKSVAVSGELEEE